MVLFGTDSPQGIESRNPATMERLTAQGGGHHSLPPLDQALGTKHVDRTGICPVGGVLRINLWQPQPFPALCPLRPASDPPSTHCLSSKHLCLVPPLLTLIPTPLQGQLQLVLQASISRFSFSGQPSLAPHWEPSGNPVPPLGSHMYDL